MSVSSLPVASEGGPSSSLERIGVLCFAWSGVEEFAVPDSVRELCEGCFQWCSSLRRVTFGPSSSLTRIGVSCFEGTGVEEFAVPDSVRELCKSCFRECKSLRRVTFGSSSSLERIGDYCFGGVRLVGFETPPSVRHSGSIFSTGLDQIFVRTPSGRLVTLECELTYKIEKVKAMIHGKEDFPQPWQGLSFAGKQLADGNTLLHYNIKPGSTLTGYHVVSVIDRSLLNRTQPKRVPPISSPPQPLSPRKIQLHTHY